MPENPAVSSTAPTTSCFYSQKLWGLNFLALKLWAGIPHSWGVLPNFYPPHVGSGPPIPHLHVSTPPAHLDELDLFNSLVVELPHSSILWWFWVIVVVQFSCNFCCDCARRQTIFTYTSRSDGKSQKLHFGHTCPGETPTHLTAANSFWVS